VSFWVPVIEAHELSFLGCWAANSSSFADIRPRFFVCSTTAVIRTGTSSTLIIGNSLFISRGWWWRGLLELASEHIEDIHVWGAESSITDSRANVALVI